MGRPQVSSQKLRHQASITATAPCRVDLAGGTLDMWPLYLFHPGSVTVNFAVNVLTTCRITPLPGRAIHLKPPKTNPEQTFAGLDELDPATTFPPPLAALSRRFFPPA